MGGYRVEWHDKRAIAEIQRKLEDATMDGAEIVANEIRVKTPVSKYETTKNAKMYGNRPGTLRDSVRVEKSKYKSGGHLVLIGGKGAWGDAYYASFVVFGTARIKKTLFPHRALSAVKRRVMARLRQVRI